jgi:hypothetical protein
VDKSSMIANFAQKHGKHMRLDADTRISLDIIEQSTVDSIRAIDGVIAVYDVTNKASFESVVSKLEQMKQRHPLCAVLVGTKADAEERFVLARFVLFCFVFNFFFFITTCTSFI